MLQFGPAMARQNSNQLCYPLVHLDQVFFSAFVSGAIAAVQFLDR